MLVLLLMLMTQCCGIFWIPASKDSEIDEMRTSLGGGRSSRRRSLGGGMGGVQRSWPAWSMDEKVGKLQVSMVDERDKVTVVTLTEG